MKNLFNAIFVIAGVFWAVACSNTNTSRLNQIVTELQGKTIAFNPDLYNVLTGDRLGNTQNIGV